MTRSIKIYILLQKHKGLIGGLYCPFKGDIYNHASIGICENMSEFYSFRSKWGFCEEHPFYFNKEYKRTLLCTIYEINVSSDVYLKIENEIRRFKLKKNDLHYSYLSLFLSVLGIKHHFLNRYYCSEFVAEILSTSGALNLAKDSSIYFPKDFHKEEVKLFYEGSAQDLDLTK